MADPSATCRVREATPEDGTAIADVHAASIRDRGSDAYDERQVQAWLANVHPERYPIGDPGFRVVVAERDDSAAVVGFGMLDCEPSDCDGATGRITAIYVHPEHVRDGVGSAILADLEQTARERGLETLVLTASRNAIEFYRRSGYEGRETVALEMTDDVSLACLRMRKHLSDGESR